MKRLSHPWTAAAWLPLLCLLIAPQRAAARPPMPDSVEYVYVELSARNLSLQAVNSFPQQLLEVVCETDTLKTVRIRTFDAWRVKAFTRILKQAPYPAAERYPAAVARYLEPTAKVNSGSALTQSVADTLFSGREQRVLEVIEKALSFSRLIAFDAQLAERLDRGLSTTEPSDSVILRMKGTCSEATNLFLALMRYMGIPARMVVGYGYEPSLNICNSHAWAECWIEGLGWWAVDPQGGHPALPCFCYKLFTGSDFEDCRIVTLPDMYLRGERHFRAQRIDSLYRQRPAAR